MAGGLVIPDALSFAEGMQLLAGGLLVGLVVAIFAAVIRVRG